MNIWVGTLILCFFLPYSTCKAETPHPYATSSAHYHPAILKDQNLQATSDPVFAQVSYGFANVRLYTGQVPEVKVDHLLKGKKGLSVSIMSTAEAAVLPSEFNITYFDKICNTISNAQQLDDLKPVLVDKNIEFLKAKVSAGVSQYVVLAMLQVIHPQKIRIIDFRVEKEWAEFAVAGNSTLGPMEGLIHMVKVEGSWKIDDESWYVSKQPDRRDGLIVTLSHSLSDPEQYIYPERRKASSGVSSDPVIYKKRLQLTKNTNNRRKKAFMFVFFMDKDKEAADQSAVVKKNPRGRMHVLGPKKIFPGQDVIEDKYPVDVSTAKYADGYASNEWNIVIPNGKPREVAVSWMWAF